MKLHHGNVVLALQANIVDVIMLNQGREQIIINISGAEQNLSLMSV